MKTPLHPARSFQAGFALISVLALVSLAALTATAFLASARLDRSATRPLGETVRLQMVLNTGRECATEVLNQISEPYWNFVSTYWRGNNLADDLGYPLVGKPYGSTSLQWVYDCAFTPATWTNLDGADMRQRIRVTNGTCQATFSNDINSFMSNATRGFTSNPPANSRICTEIPMVGGRTSPPVGWVYMKQNIRTNPSTTNTASLPFARFAYFIEDLQGLIDAERMGAGNSRSTGTNADEISLTNLVGSSATNISLAAYTNKRPQYLTPGMLLFDNGGVLTTNSDLRYFASRLRSCYWRVRDSNWGRIPMVPISSTLINGSYYPSSGNHLKLSLEQNNLNTGYVSKIAETITNNFPFFTNRAGGMNGTIYVNILAANIIDYADANSFPTAVVTNGFNVAGYDSYPLLTHVFDKITYTNNPSQLSVETYLQLWNPSSVSTPSNLPCTFLYDFADTLFATGTITPATTNLITGSPRLTNKNSGYTNSLSNTYSFSFTTNLPPISTNGGIVLSFTNSITVPGTPAPQKIWINGINNGSTNIGSFTLKIGGLDALVSKIRIQREDYNLTNNQFTWKGTIPVLRYSPTQVGDPRVLNFLTNVSTNFMSFDYSTTYWRGYPAGSSTLSLSDPATWPDGQNATRTTLPNGTNNGTDIPRLGLFSMTNPAPCRVSNSGSYSNICELGNIFDPIQWMSPMAAADTDFSNTNIISTWTPDSRYGGGSTLRIGRPEHSRFAFTNFTNLANSYPVPALGTSAAGLLDLFSVTNTYDWAGKININTAPLPVLAALAGGISLSNTNYSGTAPVNADMIRAFTNGVAKFRNTYPFITPSQLAFIATDYGVTNSPITHWTNTWPTNAVFSTNAQGGLNGPTSITDEAREEWFSKIYSLTTVQSFNYRIYVKAQLTDTNGNPKGPEIKKYYQLYLRNNSPEGTNYITTPPNISPVIQYEASY
jgi:hypothetical protein